MLNYSSLLLKVLKLSCGRTNGWTDRHVETMKIPSASQNPKKSCSVELSNLYEIYEKYSACFLNVWLSIHDNITNTWVDKLSK